MNIAPKGLFTLTAEGVGDQGEVDEGEEDAVELVDAGGDPAVVFEPAEEPFDDIALFVEHAVVLPGLAAGAERRHDRAPARRDSQPAGLVALAGAIHQQRRAARLRAQICSSRLRSTQRPACVGPCASARSAPAASARYQSCPIR